MSVSTVAAAPVTTAAPVVSATYPTACQPAYGPPGSQWLCIDSTHYALCGSNGQPAPGVSLVASAANLVPAGTLCCPGALGPIQTCAGATAPAPSPAPANPPVTPAKPATPAASLTRVANTNSCAGKVNGQIACNADGITYSVCSGNGQAQPGANTQTCALYGANLFCCEYINGCDWNSCQTGQITIGTTVVPGLPWANTKSCVGKTGVYNIACISDTQFVGCVNGSPALGPNGQLAIQNIGANQYCCEYLNGGSWYSCSGAAPVVSPSSQVIVYPSYPNWVAPPNYYYPTACSAPQGISCINSYSFYLCTPQGVPNVAVGAQNCAANSYCCGGYMVNSCSSDPTCGGRTAIYTGVTPPVNYTGIANVNFGNTYSCAGKVNNQIVCQNPGNGLYSTSYGVCQNGQQSTTGPNNGIMQCGAGSICCEGLNQCSYWGCAGTGVYNPTVIQPNTALIPGTGLLANTGSCVGKLNGQIACQAYNVYQTCNGNGLAAQSGNGPAANPCPVGTLCCEGLNRCDYSCGSTAGVSPLWPFPWVPPTSCSNIPTGYSVCTSSNTYQTCANGAFSFQYTCPAGLQCCPNLNGCGPIGCSLYTPPSNVCSNKPNNYVFATSFTSFGQCWGGQVVQAASIGCPANTVFCENLQRCDYNCGGVPTTIPTTAFQVATVVAVTPAVSYTPSCANKADGAITCINAQQYWTCQGGKPANINNPQSCNTGAFVNLGLQCCENLGPQGACGYVGCGQGGPVQPTTPVAPVNPVVPFTSGPTVDYCDTQAHDYDHMGKFCVGTRSNMWCKDGQLSRINFCPTDQICCENTGECGNPSLGGPVPCYVPKGIPQRNAGCVGTLNSCNDLADGARVCTGVNTFSYCLDQKVFVPLNQKCATGYQCCPLLGGRCEEDCNYPTQPVGHCDDQPDGASVCNGYRSYKICHNGGCLGTFDCIGSDKVCCPSTGQCAKKSDCSDQTQFWPVVDTTCKGLLNKRVCSADKNWVNVCLQGHVVAKFSASAGYNFGCDNDVVSPDSTLYN